MSGKDLKDILSAEGINLSELAAKLGFANDQRLHSALKAADVKSGLIEAIAKATNKSIGFFYRDSIGAIATDGSATVSGDGNSTNNQQGDNNTYNSSEIVIKALAELAAQRELYAQSLTRRDDQIDRLLSLLENK